MVGSSDSEGIENIPLSFCDNCSDWNARKQMYLRDADDEEEEEMENQAAAAACMAAASTLGGGAESAWCDRKPGSKSVRRLPCMWYPERLQESPICPQRQLREVFHIPVRPYRAIHNRSVAEGPRFDQ